jgi:selenoprotein W-related protein
LTAEVLTHFKQDVGEMTLVPAGGGKFEVFVDDVQIWSKLETGEFPEPRDIIRAIESRK